MAHPRLSSAISGPASFCPPSMLMSVRCMTVDANCAATTNMTSDISDTLVADIAWQAEGLIPKIKSAPTM